MHHDRLVLRTYRANRREMVRQFVGKNYSDEGTKEPIPVNLISLYVSVVARNLIAKNPRVMLSTFNASDKPMVCAMEAWVNKEIESLRLANSIQRVVLDALFSVGIMKIALATPADAACMSWRLQAGAPFCERVDLDDFIFDTHARDFDEVSYIGHRFRPPLEVIRDSKIYSKGRKDLSASTDSPYNLEGDERISRIGRGYVASDAEEFEDRVDLWEIYLPREKVVLTLADDAVNGSVSDQGGTPAPLREQDWIGHDLGPYRLLSYGIVPGNPMPKGPIQDLFDSHLAVNNIYRKAIRQAERQKENTFVQGGATEDGSRIMESSDGQILRVDNPDKIITRVMGGPNQQNLLFGQHLKDVFSWCAGNLDIMGGLSPQSRTATQDTMLDKNSTRAIADMQDRTVQFTADTLKCLCWYWYHDPFKVQKVRHSIGGVSEITRTITPERRMKAKWDDLEIQVDPYSMQHQTPQTRAQALTQLVQTIIMPMQQLLQQAGVAFDVNAYLAKMAKYMDQPDLQDLLTMRTPPDTGGGAPEGDAGAPGKPPETKRTYERRSVGQDTMANRQSEFANALSGSQANSGQQPEGAEA